MLGCDYCDSIKGIGPKSAVQLIQKHRNIETVLENIDKTRHPIPEDWPYKDARELFKKPDVIPGESIQLKWAKPDEEALVDYMVRQKGFAYVSYVEFSF